MEGDDWVWGVLVVVLIVVDWFFVLVGDFGLLFFVFILDFLNLDIG